MSSILRVYPIMRNTILGRIMLATLFACLTAIGAQIQIPIGPVPVTLQVFFVLLSGLVLGSKWGAASQLEYLVMGFSGLPVFAQGKSGLTALLGPTGGYLIGFVAGALLAGLIAEAVAKPGRVRLFLAGMAGTAGIYFFGGLWLACWFSIQQGMSWSGALEKAWLAGVAPFLLLDMAKALLAGGVTLSGRTLAEIFK